MKFEEALVYMREGKRVRRAQSAKNNHYTTINESKTALVSRVTVAEHDVVYVPTLEDLLAEDWESVG